MKYCTSEEIGKRWMKDNHHSEWILKEIYEKEIREKNTIINKQVNMLAKQDELLGRLNRKNADKGIGGISR